MEEIEQAQQQQQLELDPDEQLLIEILRLRRQSKMPDPICEKVGEAVNDFLDMIEGAVKSLLYHDAAAAAVTEVDEEVELRGLDCDLDTEEQVETMIRLFPEVLSVNKYTGYPIQHQVKYCIGQFNHLKAVSFIPLLAKLAIEFGLFEEAERGGLLALLYHVWFPNVPDHYNVLKCISCTSDINENNKYDKEYHEHIDKTFLAVMNRLHEENLLSEEDIREHNLLALLCTQNTRCRSSLKNKPFPEHRFRFLSDLNPTTLMTSCCPEIENWLPIMYIALHCNFRGFQVVLEAGMRHYAPKLGFVFYKIRDENGDESLGEEGLGITAYRLACARYGTEKVTNEVLDRISQYYPATTTTSVGSCLLSLATDDEINLDGLYLFLRREPAALAQLLQTRHNSNSSSSTTTTTTTRNIDSHKIKRERDKKIDDDKD